jgi:hypothetical protein|tara:strand:+ start:863 stop:1036 length:174 start_codon:yes stop_codon:yes gene_type:complete
MGRTKEVFLEHQQENENIYETYYKELYKVGYAIGATKKEFINSKTKNNGTRNKKRNA